MPGILSRLARGGRAALLRVVLAESDAFLGDAVDVWRLVTHHATLIVANLGLSFGEIAELTRRGPG